MTKSIITVLQLATLFAGSICAAQTDHPSVEQAKSLISKLKRGSFLMESVDLMKSGFRMGPQNSRIVIFVPRDALDKILGSEIKNLHQTKVSMGSNNEPRRKAFENTTLQEDLDLSANSKILRPKSGIVLNALTSEFINPSDHYGSVALVMKPEVFERSLWSHVDSLETVDFSYDLYLPKPFSIPYDHRIFPEISLEI